MFDLDGTLRYNKPSSLHFFLDCAVRLGVDDNPENRRRAIRWAHRYWAQPENLVNNLRLYFERDERFLIDYSSQYLEAFGCDKKQAALLSVEVNRMMIDEFNPIDSVPVDVFETLEYLRSQEFRLAIVTNRHEPCSKQLDSLGLSPYFEMTVIAGVINRWKPEAGIFTYALDKMGINSSEALYVGDNYYSDVVGAQQVGLLPVLIDPEGIFPEADCQVISRLGDLITLDYKMIK